MLGNHFENFIAQQLKSGRYNSASDVIQAALKLLEDREIKLERLHLLFEEGEHCGVTNYSYDKLMDELDNEAR